MKRLYFAFIPAVALATAAYATFNEGGISREIKSENMNATTTHGPLAFHVSYVVTEHWTRDETKHHGSFWCGWTITNRTLTRTVSTTKPDGATASDVATWHAGDLTNNNQHDNCNTTFLGTMTSRFNADASETGWGDDITNDTVSVQQFVNKVTSQL